MFVEQAGVNVTKCHWKSYSERYPDLEKAFGGDENKLEDHYVAPSAGGGKNQGRNCENNLSFRHAPIIVLHSKEKYFPYDVKEWFQNTVVKKHVTKDAPARYLKEGFDAKTIAKYKEEIPVLYEVAYYSTGETKTITYFVYFAYNGSKRIAGSAPTGAHEADMEMIMIEFTKKGEIAFIGLSSHGDLHAYNVKPGTEKELKNHPKHPGNLINTERKIKFENGKPIVYCSVNAHAFYGEPGSYVRFGGFGNDNTNEGKRLLTIPEHVSDAPEVMQFKGYIGKASVSDYSSRLDNKKRPKIYDASRPHFSKLNNTATYGAYLLYFILPFLVQIFKGDLRISVMVFFGQFYFIKLLLYLIGPYIGIKRDEDTILHWLFPFRFF